MALLGCEVVVTDQVEVLPLLLRNTERNLARAKHSASEYPRLGIELKARFDSLQFAHRLLIFVLNSSIELKSLIQHFENCSSRAPDQILSYVVVHTVIDMCRSYWISGGS